MSLSSRVSKLERKFKCLKCSSLGDSAEYTFSSINPSNEISLLKDGVPVSTIDLTPYLDDTNLARLVSGVLDAAGNLTVTRDDSSSFVIDLSALFDAEVKAYFGNDAGLTDWTNDNLGAGLFRFNGITGKLEFYNYGDSTWKVLASDAELANLLADFTEFRESTGVADYVDTRYTFASPLSVAANTPIIIPNNSGIIWDVQKPVDIDTMFYSVKLDISSITGTFQKGEVITGGTSGATAVVASVYPLFLLLVNISNTPFQVAETVTGGISGATSTVDTVNFDYGITGRDGDGLLFTVEFFVIPTNVNTTYLETTIDIGGAVGEIYPRIHTFPKGQGEIRPISFSIGGYTRDTWESNSGMVIVEANGTFDLYGVRHVLTRTHKAR